MKKRYGILVVALAGLALLWGGARYFTRSRSDSSVLKVQASERPVLRFFRDPAQLPGFTAVDLEGRRLSSSDWRQKVVLVNFWATWCGPCREEIPHLVALQEKYRDRLVILGVSVDEVPPERVRQFAEQHRINYPVVMTTPELDKVFARSEAIPTLFVLDREFRVAQRHTGLISPDLAELEVRALAGLPVDASIEQVDRIQGIKLENYAHATSIPGLDLAGLTADQRMTALQKLNAEPCTCGCELTVARCRIEDPACGTSLPLAHQIVEKIKKEQ